MAVESVIKGRVSCWRLWKRMICLERYSWLGWILGVGCCRKWLAKFSDEVV